MKIVITENEYVIYKDGREIAAFDLEQEKLISSLIEDFNTIPIYSDVDQD